MKQCSKCGEWRELAEFNTKQSCCKLCQKQYCKEYYKKNKGTIRENHIKNKEKIAKYMKTYRKQYRVKNKDKMVKRKKEYQKSHRKEINKYYKERRKNNPKIKLSQTISTLMRRSLKGNKNGIHWEDKVDYTLEDLTTHLKTTIPKGFTWQDYLDGKLHFEHIIPIYVFNFDNYSQLDFERCWALSNLRLLEATENMKKNNKIDKPFQPSLKIKMEVKQ